MTTAQRAEMPGWITDHIKAYTESNGEDGHAWRGVQTLLLTTTGRKSGEPLLLPLIYGKQGDQYLIVASKGGAAAHPAWYLNLRDNPKVEVQVGAEKFAAKARTAVGTERPAFWETMSKIWPAYNEYQQKTTRQIPVVVLSRV